MAESNTSVSIPVVDMTAPNADRDYVEGKREFGFVAVVNHGVDTALIRKAHSLIEQVMSLPTESLIECHHTQDESTKFRSGYFAYGEEKAKGTKKGWDLKHFYHLFRRGHSLQCRYPQAVPDFEPIMGHLFDSLDTLSGRLLTALTDNSGTNPCMPYQDMTGGGDTLLRALHYPTAEHLMSMIPALDDLGYLPPGEEKPTYEDIAAALQGSVRASAHEDINLITLLVAATEPGLQILTKDKQWLDVNNPEDSIVVNTGDMFQVATLGEFPSMTHRVVNTGLEEGSRISIPFFVHPRPEVPLVTATQYANKMIGADGSSVSPKVKKQLEELGLHDRLNRACELGTDETLCSAGEYLQRRLEEIGNIKE